MAPPLVLEPPVGGEQPKFELIMKHGHQDLVQAVAFNSYGDRCATGSVDGKIRVFNRHKDGVWRHCDNWTAHGGEILELQWLPPTIYPNLVASLGIEGRFKLWAEDPAAAPGRRFSQRNKESAKAAYEHKSSRLPYRSFSLKHNDETRHTYLALLAADGTLEVLENDQPENLAEYAPLDKFTVCARPARGEETSFRVRFDPNPDPCYTALRAGVPTDSLSLVVAAMDTVRIYRTRDAASFSSAAASREFYLAAEITGHRGLVRDVAWAPGNIRGYDIIATACQDGFVRVVRVDTPSPPDDDKTWSSRDLVEHGASWGGGAGSRGRDRDSNANAQTLARPQSAITVTQQQEQQQEQKQQHQQQHEQQHEQQHQHQHQQQHQEQQQQQHQQQQQILQQQHQQQLLDEHDQQLVGSDPLSSTTHHQHLPLRSGIGSELARTNSGSGASGLTLGGSGGSGFGFGFGSGGGGSVSIESRRPTGQPGEVEHEVRELSLLDSHRTPVWRVDFDDDGQILGSVGDEGRLMCYRQTPDGTWAKSSELAMMKMRMSAP